MYRVLSTLVPTSLNAIRYIMFGSQKWNSVYTHNLSTRISNFLLFTYVACSDSSNKDYIKTMSPYINFFFFWIFTLQFQWQANLSNGAADIGRMPPLKFDRNLSPKWTIYIIKNFTFNIIIFYNRGIFFPNPVYIKCLFKD